MELQALRLETFQFVESDSYNPGKRSTYNIWYKAWELQDNTSPIYAYDILDPYFPQFLQWQI